MLFLCMWSMTFSNSPDTTLQGIEVVTPKERKAAQITNTMNDNSDGKLISYIYIPANSVKEIQELTFRPDSKALDTLLDHVKPAFVNHSQQVDLTLLPQPTLFGTQDATPQVSNETLQKVAQEAHVEVFSLVQPTMSNNQTALNIYLDEVGMLKRLPTNQRASQFAARAGYNPPPTFYGDVFVGRVRRRTPLSLTLEEIKSPGWLAHAVRDNLDHQKQQNERLGRQGELQPSVDGVEQAKTEDGYAWTQTEEELEVSVDLPPKVLSSKQVKVIFRSQKLEVALTGNMVVTVVLFERVDPDGCTWTLDQDERKLVISMEKVEPALWPRIRD